MSRENVENMQRFLDAYSRGDLQATLALLAPEFEFRPSGVFMDTAEVYRGREGWSEFWHTFHAAWESIAVSVDRIEDLGEQLLVLGTFQGTGEGSGVDVTRQSGWVVSFHDGLMAQTQSFARWHEALEAVGLSE